MNVKKIAVWSSSCIATIAVVAGLALSGSPGEQRLKRLDERRIFDLTHLARALDAYWEDHERLPPDVKSLMDGRVLSRIPTDPATDRMYEYHVDEPRRYRLCANFDRPSSEKEARGFWAHPDGRQCYEFEAAASAKR